MGEGHAESALALEQFDGMLVVAPLAAQHFDGDDAAGARIVGAKDAAKAAGRNLVEDAIAAEEVAVLVPLEELGALPGGQRAFALGDFEKGLRLAAALTQIVPDI